MNQLAASRGCYQLGRYAMFLFALSLFFSKALQNISFGLGLVSFFILLCLKDKSLSFGDKQLRYVMFIMTVGLAIFTSFSAAGFSSTQTVISRYYKYLMFFPLVAFIRNKKDLRIFLSLSFMSLCVGHLLNAQILVNGVFRTSKFFDVIGYADILSIALGMLLAFILFWQTRISIKWLFVFVLIVTLYALIINGTRGAYIAVVPVMLSLLVVRKKWLAILAVLGILACYLVLPLGYQARIKSIVNTKEHSNRIRLLMWQASMYTFTKNPIFGAGYGGNQPFFEDYYKQSGDWEYVQRVYPNQDNAHSTYFSWMSRFGAMFFFLLYVKFWLIPKKLFFLYQKRQDSFDQAFILAMSAGFLSFYLTGLTENQTTKQVTAYFFVTLIALLSIQLSLSKESACLEKAS